MKSRWVCSSLLVAFVAVASVNAEELKSGPQVGEAVGAFTVEKCAGNDSDGVSAGDKLCYRCMLGKRPVVAIFARTPDSKLAQLVQEIDGVVAHNEDKKLASFVNLLGEDPEQLKSHAKKLVSESKASKVAVVVPVDHEQGPKNYKLNPDADVTVLVYNNGKVEANYALPAGKLNKAIIEKISASANELVN